MVLAKEKERLLACIDEKEVVELTRQLVRIPSPTGQEAPIARFLHDYLESAGFSVVLDEAGPGRPNVMARLKGSGKGPVILLNGHIDTVPPGEGWIREPHTGEISGNFIWGRGATDMKGGIAVMAVAMKALKESGLEFPGEVVLAGVVGEEENQLGTRHLLDSGFRADYAIVGEPTDMLVVNSHKGAINCDITVNGKGAHASTPEQGLNAIYHGSRISLALEEYSRGLKVKSHPVLGSPTLVVGTVQGGQVPYMVADYCRISIDRRLIPGEEYDAVAREIQDVIDAQNKKFPEFSTVTKLTVATPPMETDPRSPVVACLRKNAAEILGADPGYSGWPAVSDGNLMVEAGIPTTLFGPGSIGRMAHKPDEGVEIDQLRAAARVISMTLLELLKHPI